MRILLVSYLYQPHNEIGAVRPTNMSRWLAEFGHDVTVICANPQGAQRSGKAAVHSVGHGGLIRRGQEKIAAVVQARRKADIKPQGYSVPDKEDRKKGIFSKNIIRSLRLWGWGWLMQMDWFFQCKKYCRKNLKKDYDLILSSYGPFGSLWLGSWLRRKGYGRVWVSDMRDPIVNNMQEKIINRYSRWLERRMLRTAERVVCVSVGEADYFRRIARNDRIRKKIFTVENGYEPAEEKQDVLADKVLRITYTGMLYLRKSDFTAVLESVGQLLEEGAVSAGGIEIHYAGPQGSEFADAAEKAGVAKAAVNHGMLPRPEALALQQRSDILCVLGWNDHDAQGHLPGKFWEYLRAEKPILSVVSGNLANAELTRRVRELSVGFAYEYITDREDAPQMREYLLSCWRQKQAGKALSYEPDREKVLDYRYDNRTRRMETILREALEEKGD